MIFLGHLIQLSIINTDSSFIDYSSGNQFIVLILDHGYPSFLWYALNGADPLTIRNGKDDAMIKELDDFFLHHF